MNKNQNCTVEPIRKRQHIEAIKDALAVNPRDTALFQIGINAGLRGTDLLRLKWLDVLSDEGQIKKVIELNESKTKKLRRIAISPNMRKAIETWLGACTPDRHSTGASSKSRTIDRYDLTKHELLFPNGKDRPMTIQRLHQLVNEWARKADIQGHFGSCGGRDLNRAKRPV